MNCVCYSFQLAISSPTGETTKNIDFLVWETTGFPILPSTKQYMDICKGLNGGEEPLKILVLQHLMAFNRTKK